MYSAVRLVDDVTGKRGDDVLQSQKQPAALLALAVARVNDFAVGGRTVSSLLVYVVQAHAIHMYEMLLAREDVALQSCVMRAFRPSVWMHVCHDRGFNLISN